MEVKAISDLNLPILATHEVLLVVLSVVIAVVASYTALDLAGRVTLTQGRARNIWLVGGAIAMGIGIWSMHFIAMLAYHLPIPVNYDSLIVLLSMVVAIVASGAALFIVSRQTMGKLQFFAGGIFMGLGVTAMHYIGMAAMHQEAIAQYDLKLVALSVIVAISASLAALWLAFHLRTQTSATGNLRKIGSAILMGNAIAGMHYIAMAAVSFKVTDQPVVQPHYAINTNLLAVAIGIASLLILSLTLLSSIFDQRIKAETASKYVELEKANEQLRCEIAERQRAEEEVRFLQTMTQAISESSDFHSALGVTLCKVCEVTGWKYGEAWIPGSDGTTLECSPAWYGSHQNLEKFRQLSEGLTFPPATGLPGRVWSSRQPEWVPDVSSVPDTVFLRKQFVTEAVFKAGLGVPIIGCSTEEGNPEVLAVLVFFMFESCEEEKRLVEIVSTIATQLGSLIQRKRAESALRQSEERFRLLVEGVKDYAICMLNTDGQIVSWNTAGERIKGYRVEEILGRHFSCFYPEEDIALGKPEQALHVCRVNGQIEDEGWRVRKDGSQVWVNVVMTALRDEDGKLRGFSKVTRDMTERKRAEENIRNALEKQKQLSELKSRFISMTSHEFRTPLTTILSSAELLESYGKKWTEEKKLQHFHRIQTAVKQMTALLNDVLLLGKAEAGKLVFNPEPLNIAQFCRELVEELEISTGNNHTIAFCSQGQCTAAACMDEKLLRQILSNLLSNAIKYSPQGGTVRFDLICKQEEVVFQVQDQGIGIPAADQAQLFDTFHRASNVGTISGTGLGLAIVKKSVDLHGGEIRVKSEVGIGTTFTVTIPLVIRC